VQRLPHGLGNWRDSGKDLIQDAIFVLEFLSLDLCFSKPCVMRGSFEPAVRLSPFINLGFGTGAGL
jgi:hypothetical protein